MSSTPSAALPAYQIDRLTRGARRSSRADELQRWQRPERYYYRELIRLLRLHIPAGASVLQIGCGMGDLLHGVAPSRGVGIDLSDEVVARARRRYPELTFIADEPESFHLDEKFDYVIVGDAVCDMADVQACFERVRSVCRPTTRVIVSYVNALWEPVLRLASLLRLRRPTGEQNWLNTHDVRNLLTLSGFDVIRHDREMILPVNVPVVSSICNRLLARVWPTHHLALTHMLVARVNAPPQSTREPSCSVVIPALNERGNIEAAVRRMPRLGRHTELIFVDGGSDDGTVDEIERMIRRHPDKDIKLIHQGDGVGKGDAVRKGFAAAEGDILMILDSDLTVGPEELPKFFECIRSGRGEFINGTRLVYPMAKQAMRSLNKMGNWFFSALFSWLLRQKFRDTLCGTKVLSREAYQTIANNRSYFGDFDPFGDFDLIFGASKANLKIVEVPVRYAARTYGETKISRFRHGLLLLRMSLVALRKLRLR